MKKIIMLLLLSVMLVSIGACSTDDGGTSETNPDIVANPDPDPDPDVGPIIDFFKEDSDYSLLVEALEKTGFDNTLGNSGTYTIFAPNNAAFEMYLDGTTLNDITTDDLTQLLLNHVLETSISSDNLVTGYVSTMAQDITSQNAISMHINTTSGVVINGSITVVNSDVERENGIIHEVDQIIPLPFLITFIKADPNFATLSNILDDSSLNYDSLWSRDVNDGAPAPFTLFTPDNDAFIGVTLPDNDTELNYIIVHHLLTATNLRSNNFVSGTITTSRGDALLDASGPTIQGGLNQTPSTITLVDIQATNGVIHAIDQVLIPAPQPD